MVQLHFCIQSSWPNCSVPSCAAPGWGLCKHCAGLLVSLVIWFLMDLVLGSTTSERTYGTRNSSSHRQENSTEWLHAMHCCTWHLTYTDTSIGHHQLFWWVSNGEKLPWCRAYAKSRGRQYRRGRNHPSSCCKTNGLVHTNPYAAIASAEKVNPRWRSWLHSTVDRRKIRISMSWACFHMSSVIVRALGKTVQRPSLIWISWAWCHTPCALM